MSLKLSPCLRIAFRRLMTVGGNQTNRSPSALASDLKLMVPRGNADTIRADSAMKNNGGARARPPCRRRKKKPLVFITRLCTFSFWHTAGGGARVRLIAHLGAGVELFLLHSDIANWEPGRERERHWRAGGMTIVRGCVEPRR